MADAPLEPDGRAVAGVARRRHARRDARADGEAAVGLRGDGAGAASENRSQQREQTRTSAWTSQAEVARTGPFRVASGERQGPPLTRGISHPHPHLVSPIESSPPLSMQAVVFVLPVWTVPSLQTALVVSGVTAFFVFFAAFSVPSAVSFAASVATCEVFFAVFFAASPVALAACFAALPASLPASPAALRRASPPLPLSWLLPTEHACP